MLRTRFLAPLALALAAVPGAQTPVQARLFTRTEGGVVRAAIEIELEGDWHLYHQELGHPRAIGQPTTVVFQGADIEWGAVRFPEPVRLDQSEVAGEGVFILAHEHELVLYAAGKLRAGASTDGLEVKLKGLVCDDVKGCIPYRQTLSSEGAGADALFAAFPAALLPSASASAAQPEEREAAQAWADPLASSKTWSSASDSAADGPPREDRRSRGEADATLHTRIQGNEVRAALEIVITPGWHLYHEELGPSPYGKPGVVTLHGAGVTWEKPVWPEPQRFDQSDIEEGLYILGHEGTIVVYARGELAAGAATPPIWGEIEGQTCADVCIDYRETFTDAGRGADGAWSGWDAARARPPTGSAPAETAHQPPPEAPPDEKGLLGFLLLAIGGGLFALVMPCTYPMIPITISFFTKQAEKRGANAVSLSLAYGAGIVLIFVLVGVLFGALVKPFATHPVTNLVLAAAFVYFALVLFGALNLEPPRFLMNLAGSASTRGGYVGVFLMGATLVVTSFTCTAPFVGSLLSFGASGGSPARVALGMTAFGLTMAIPFVLLSLLPARMRTMPRSGEWMNTVKVTLGFVELAAALKFLSNTDLVWQWGWLSRELFLFLWVGIFGVAALYLLGLIHVKSATTAISPGRLMTGLGFALFSLYCWNGTTESALDPVMTAIIPNYSNRAAGAGGGEGSGSHVIVVDEYAQARARALAEGKLLLVDFTGYTCVNCRLNEEKVFPAAPVRELLREHFVEARLHTDGPRGEELSAFQERLTSSIATPLYVVLDPVSERRLRGPIGGVQTVDGFAGFLRAALEARDRAEEVGRLPER